MAGDDRFDARCRRWTGRWARRISATNTRRLIGLTVTGIVSVVAFVVLIRDGRRLLTYSFRLDPLLVSLSFVVECTGLPLAVVIWRGVLGRFGSHLRYRDDFRIYCYSMLGIVVPGGFWPMVSRAALYERHGVASLRVAAASVVESVLIGLAGLMVYGLSSTLAPSENVWQHPVVALAAGALALVLIQPPVFNRMIDWLRRRVHLDDQQPISLRYVDLGRWLTIQGVIIVIGGGAVYLLLCGFTAVPSRLFLRVVSAWAIAAAAGNLFFWMPGTNVIRDGAMTLILMQALPASAAILFVLLVRVWTIASVLVVAALAWLFLERKNPLCRGVSYLLRKFHNQAP